jgi:hypothetical protein
MAIGRISPRTPAEAKAIVDKLVAYETHAPPGDWRRRALFVADYKDPSFVPLSDELASRLPPFYSVTRIYTGYYQPPANPKSDITRTISSGVGWVNYVGHGNIPVWATWGGAARYIFRDTDVPTLSNGPMLPFVAVANCLNGYFAQPTVPSLADALVRPGDRGAIGVWAPAGVGYAFSEAALMDAFYRAVFEGGERRPGLAAMQAKIEAWTTYGIGLGTIVETYNLIGDPATQLAIPDVRPRLFLPWAGRARTSP